MEVNERTTQDDLARRVRRLEDEAAVRDHVTRYGFAVDTNDADGMAALYAEDCVIDIDGAVRFEGREATKGIVHSPEHQAILPNCAHLMSPLVVTVEGDTATATGYGCVLARDPESKSVEVLRLSYGRWELARDGDGWLVARRTARAVGHPEAQALLHQGL